MKIVVQFALIHQLRVLSTRGLEFDGYFKTSLIVDALVNLSEGSLVKFADDLVVFPNFLGNLRHEKSDIFKK